MSIYKDKRVLLASMHKKELAIQEPFESIIGCQLDIAENFNTDKFGTFSGEIERSLSAYETLKIKAIKAAEQFNCDYVVSSEGAFGPHPTCLFANSDIEMLLFYDRPNNLFIADYEISTDTNLANYTVKSGNDYHDFLTKALFPSHALIIKSDDTVIAKGINNYEILEQLIADNLPKFGSLTLETDMRAMHNPSRMKVINSLANKLAKRIINHCKSCDSPGFGEVVMSGALLCELCLSPTKIKKYRDYKCIRCDYIERELIDSSKEFADPKFCDYCNP